MCSCREHMHALTDLGRGPGQGGPVCQIGTSQATPAAQSTFPLWFHMPSMFQAIIAKCHFLLYKVYLAMLRRSQMCFKHGEQISGSHHVRLDAMTMVSCQLPWIKAWETATVTLWHCHYLGWPQPALFLPSYQSLFRCIFPSVQSLVLRSCCRVQSASSCCNKQCVNARLKPKHNSE